MISCARREAPSVKSYLYSGYLDTISGEQRNEPIVRVGNLSSNVAEDKVSRDMPGILTVTLLKHGQYRA